MSLHRKISEEMIRAARGEFPVDVVLKGGNLVNVLSGEIYECDIAIWRDFVVGLGKGYHAREVVDVSGLYVSPGFIDGHVHIESSMVEVPQFARAVVPRGTTSVVADPHEIANVLGYDGIRYILETSKYNPLNVFIMLPSCVPASPLETSGSRLRAFDIYPFFSEKWVLGLAEVMNYPGVLSCDPELMDKLKISHAKRIDGHAPGLSGRDLCAYAAAGITSDHECTTVEEAEEKLRLGFHVMIREGTGAKNLDDLLPLVTSANQMNFSLVTDDRHPADIVEEGHMDFLVRKAVRGGLDPVTAIRMATVNTARYFMLDTHGVVAPGCFADLVVFESLEDIRVRKVFKSGKLVAEDGKPLFEPPRRRDDGIRASVNIRWLEGGEFSIRASGSKARVIEVVEGQIVTGQSIEEPLVRDGLVVSDPARDILKIAVVERHKATGNIGKGLIRGFGLREGAIASSIAHDSHNLIVVGVEDRDMEQAIIHLNRIGGGLVVVKDGKVIGDLPCPVAGLMSTMPLEDVHRQTRQLNEIVKLLGSGLSDPFMTLSFMALPVIPQLKITDRGLVDVPSFSFVDLFVE